MQDYFYMLQVMGFLILIIIGCYAAIRYGLRAFYPMAKRGHITVLERVPLDHKNGSSLLLVKAGDELLLIGVAQGRVSLLKEMPPESLPGILQEEQLSGRCPAASPFARILESVKYRTKRDPGEGGMNG